MSAILTEVDGWLLAVVLAAAMLAGWGAGWWWGRRLQAEKHPVPESKFNDASLALLGLLLAFTFSMSLAKHDQRHLMVVADGNAIGDFSTCARLLKEPVRGKLQGVIREYVEHQLGLANVSLGAAEFDDRLTAVQKLHNRMRALVKEAVDGRTPITDPLVNTLNAVIRSHASRLAAGEDRLPPSIVFVLMLSAVLSMVLVGRHQGTTGASHFVATLGFTALVCLVVWVTLDLNQPTRGMILVSQEPLQRLLAEMGQ